MGDELAELKKMKDEEEKLIPIGLKIIGAYEKLYKKQKDCITYLDTVKESLKDLDK